MLKKFKNLIVLVLVVLCCSFTTTPAAYAYYDNNYYNNNNAIRLDNVQPDRPQIYEGEQFRINVNVYSPQQIPCQVRIQCDNGPWVGYQQVFSLQAGNHTFNVQLVAQNGYQDQRTINVQVMSRNGNGYYGNNGSWNGNGYYGNNGFYGTNGYYGTNNWNNNWNGNGCWNGNNNIDAEDLLAVAALIYIVEKF